MDNTFIWKIWMIIAILFLILEAFLPTFLATCISIGCVAAGIFSYLNFGLEIQLFSFSIGVALSFFLVRPIMINYAYKRSHSVKTNVYALEGKIGKVVVKIDDSISQGRIIVEGDDWKAESYNGATINEGQSVEILKVNSTTLIVKPYIKN